MARRATAEHRTRAPGRPACALPRRCLAAAALALAFAGTAPAALAQTPVLLDANGVSVAAWGGWAAWSRVDGATGMYALVTRSPAGVFAPAPVAERPSPFDVELGPGRGARVAAVYSRCANARTLAGCHLLLLQLGSGRARERALDPPGRGSDHEPALWREQLVFVRSQRSSHARSDAIFAWSMGSRRTAALALPRSRGNSAAGWPAGLTGAITGLTFNGMQVGYVTAKAVGTFSETSLWFQALGARAVLIDQQTGGAGNVCPPAFVSPVLSGKWLYAYLHACDPSADPRLDRLTRYRHGEVQTARYTFIRFGDEAIDSAVPDGNGVDWDAGGVMRLAPVSWRTVAAPVPQTFCSRSDPFC